MHHAQTDSRGPIRGTSNVPGAPHLLHREGFRLKLGLVEWANTPCGIRIPNQGSAMAAFDSVCYLQNTLGREIDHCVLQKRTRSSNSNDADIFATKLMKPSQTTINNVIIHPIHRSEPQPASNVNVHFKSTHKTCLRTNRTTCSIASKNTSTQPIAHALRIAVSPTALAQHIRDPTPHLPSVSFLRVIHMSCLNISSLTSIPS